MNLIFDNSDLTQTRCVLCIGILCLLKVDFIKKILIECRLCVGWMLTMCQECETIFNLSRTLFQSVGSG